MILLGVALLGAYYLGKKCVNAPVSNQIPVAVRAKEPHRPDGLGAPPLHESTPSQVADQSAAVRRARIASDIEAIRSECGNAADGNWSRWLVETESYRQTLRDRIACLKEIGDSQSPIPEGHCQPLAGFGGFPLFEFGPRIHLAYLFDAKALDEFRSRRYVVAVDRWLRRRGIDLIFVPVPKMTEVYIEHFVSACPADGIVAPQARQTLLELLSADVETVDGWRLFRPVREPNPYYLFHTADTHWAPRGMQVMATELAGRIRRYQFAQVAWRQPPVVTHCEELYATDGVLYLTLDGSQRNLAGAARTKQWLRPCLTDGSAPPDDPTSPVLLVGHSYVTSFREFLIEETNLLVRTAWSPHMTTEVFTDLLREPEKLAGVKVIIWITTEQHLTEFKPLPAQIVDSVRDGM
jgi:hypothetical protein